MRTRVTANDAMWLQETPENRMIINAVVITDRMDLVTLRQTLSTRLLEGEAGRRFARLKARIVRQGGAPHWEQDPAFHIDRQVFAPEGPEPTTLEALQVYVGEHASRPIPEDRPRWEVHFVEHFEADASAFMVRVHHSIADGMALVGVMFAVFDEMTPGQGDVPPPVRPSSGAAGRGLWQALRVPLGAPGVLLSRLLWKPDRHRLHGPALSGAKRVAWTPPLDLEVVKGARKQLNATVNDVLMAVVSGAMTRYLKRHGGVMLQRLRVSMPVNVRPFHEPIVLENRFAAVPLEIPAGVEDLPDRIAQVKDRMDDLKRSAAPVVVYALQKVLLAALPEAVSRALIDFLANKCTAVVTNVPGPQQPIALAGRLVRSFIFWVPQRAAIGLGLSILSFAGKVQIGVLADTALLPDPEDLVQAFEEEFEALKALGPS